MSERIIRPRRSFIFTPGLKPDMYPKALASGADIVCVELEDGIAPKDKADARRNALALFETPQADDGVERIVRINSMRERFGIEDVHAVLTSKTPPPRRRPSPGWTKPQSARRQLTHPLTTRPSGQARDSSSFMPPSGISSTPRTCSPPTQPGLSANSTFVVNVSSSSRQRPP